MTKRSHGESALSQKKNGTWQCQIMVGRKPDSKRDIRTFPGKTQKEVKAKRDECLRIKEGGLLNGTDIRFDEWAEQWFSAHKENANLATAEEYKYTLRILTDHFGRKSCPKLRQWTLSGSFVGSAERFCQILPSHSAVACFFEFSKNSCQ